MSTIPPTAAPDTDLCDSEPWSTYLEARQTYLRALDDLVEATAGMVGYEGLLLEHHVLVRELRDRVRAAAARYPPVLRLQVWRDFKAGAR